MPSGSWPSIDLVFEQTQNMPAPSFISGAGIWLKQNRLAIGLITNPTLWNVSATD